MTLPLHPAAVEVLQKGRNLLAFSAGVDSTALFHLLLEAGIPFDLAMVDYGVREQSKEEVAYARELAECHHKQLHLKTARPDEGNFEARAREIRYSFFAELCHNGSYDTVITAHQLNDRTEWLLMQLVKGAGTVELLGMDYVDQRDAYTLIRPMLDLDRPSIETYLKERSIPYFEDATNRDMDFTRNAFRHTVSNPLVKEYAGGIRQSFALLRRDAQSLMPSVPTFSIEELILIRRTAPQADIRHIDRHLKRMGYLPSAAQKGEILRQKESVIGGKIVVSLGDETICIAPYLRGTILPKRLREKFRLAGVPPKIRPYLYTMGITEREFTEGLEAILS